MTQTDNGYKSNNNLGTINLTGKLTNLVEQQLDNLLEKLGVSGANQAGYDLPDEQWKLYSRLFNADTKIYNTPESRARKYPYTDPLQLNFKLMIDWGRHSGLFAAEKYTNSALAYMKRVFGDDSIQYMNLKLFIEKFKDFIQYYDFLVLNIDGLQEAYSIKPGNFPIEGENNLTVIVRETVRWDFQYILNLYQKVWYDERRGVEILPANLRRFDCWVLVYQSGYYNMMFHQNPDYDPNASMESRMQKKDDNPDYFFPTLMKLHDIDNKPRDNYGFNCMLFDFYDAQIVPWESGKNLFGDLSNEPNSDFAKNNLTLSYRFTRNGVEHDGINLDILAFMAADSKTENESGNKKGWLKELVSAYGSQALDALKQAKNQQLKTLKNVMMTSVKGLIGKASPIGNALDFFTDPYKLIGSVSDAISGGVSMLAGQYVYDNITKINQIVMQNFSETVLSDMVYDNLRKKTILQDVDTTMLNDRTEATNKSQAIGVLDNGTNTGMYEDNQHYTPEGIPVMKSGVEYQDNIVGENGKNVNSNIIYQDTIVGESGNDVNDNIEYAEIIDKGEPRNVIEVDDNMEDGGYPNRSNTVTVDTDMEDGGIPNRGNAVKFDNEMEDGGIPNRGNAVEINEQLNTVGNDIRKSKHFGITYEDMGNVFRREGF